MNSTLIRPEPPLYVHAAWSISLLVLAVVALAAIATPALLMAWAVFGWYTGILLLPAACLLMVIGGICVKAWRER